MLARPDHSAGPSRSELLDQLAELVAWLAAHPDIPITEARVYYVASPDATDDTDGIARIDDLGSLTGLPVDRHDGHHKVTRDFGGQVVYEAFYIERATYRAAVAAHA